MKRKLTTKAWNELDAAIQKLYKKTAGADGKDESYVLDLEDEDEDDDPNSAAVRAKNREKEARKEAERKLREAQKELAALKDAEDEAAKEKARKSGDTAALEDSWKKKLADMEAELRKEVTKRDDHLRKLLVDVEADKMAREISTVPAAMARLIKDRLIIEMSDGEPVLRVLDSNGKPSALTLAELKKEFVSNKELSGMILGSKASGGGATQANGASGSAVFKIEEYQNPDKTVNWTKVAEAEKKVPGTLKQVRIAIGQIPNEAKAE